MFRPRDGLFDSEWGHDPEMIDMVGLTRRRLLSWCAALALVPGAAGVAAGAMPEPAPDDLSSHMRDLLGEIFGDRAAAQALGEAYLRRYPTRPESAEVMKDLLADHSPRDAAALGRLVTERRVRDFREGRTVVLDGWVLARSEAQLCALTVLL